MHALVLLGALLRRSSGCSVSSQFEITESYQQVP